jgi:HNH endonuclease
MSEYAPCQDHPGYTASIYGEIFNPQGKPVKQQPDGNGGLKVHIGDTTVGVHTLILRAFTGKPPKWLKLRPRWQNGNRCDNRLDNLMWGKKPRRK